MKPHRKRRVDHLEQRRGAYHVSAQGRGIMALLARRSLLPGVTAEEEARIVHQMALDLVAEYQLNGCVA